MISSDDFPCYVNVFDGKKIDPKGLKWGPDEIKHFNNIGEYIRWTVDVDGPDCCDGPEFEGWSDRTEDS